MPSAQCQGAITLPWQHILSMRIIPQNGVSDTPNCQCAVHTHYYVTTVVSQASAHVPHFKGSLQQLLYKCMEIMSWVNRDVCLSVRGCLPGTLRYHDNAKLACHCTARYNMEWISTQTKMSSQSNLELAQETRIVARQQFICQVYGHCCQDLKLLDTIQEVST